MKSRNILTNLNPNPARNPVRLKKPGPTYNSVGLQASRSVMNKSQLILCLHGLEAYTLSVVQAAESVSDNFKSMDDRRWTKS